MATHSWNIQNPIAYYHCCKIFRRASGCTRLSLHIETSTGKHNLLPPDSLLDGTLYPSTLNIVEAEPAAHLRMCHLLGIRSLATDRDSCDIRCVSSCSSVGNGALDANH
jgi:hypothetical protein